MCDCIKLPYSVIRSRAVFILLTKIHTPEYYSIYQVTIFQMIKENP
jgi:hypothetical protein